MSAIGSLLTLVGLAALAVSLSGVSAPQLPMTPGLPIPAIQNMPDRAPIVRQLDPCYPPRIVSRGADAGLRANTAPQRRVMGRDATAPSACR
jgi:hypothetical protein